MHSLYNRVASPHQKGHHLKGRAQILLVNKTCPRWRAVLSFSARLEDENGRVQG